MDKYELFLCYVPLMINVTACYVKPCYDQNVYVITFLRLLHSKCIHVFVHDFICTIELKSFGSEFFLGFAFALVLNTMSKLKANRIFWHLSPNVCVCEFV